MMFWIFYILYICVLALYFQSEYVVRLSLRQRRTFWTLSTAGITAALFFLEDRPVRLPWILDHAVVRLGLWLSTVVLVRRAHWAVINKLHLTRLSRTGVQTLKSQRPPRFLPNDLGMGLLLDQLLAPLDEIEAPSESESESESEGEGGTRRRRAHWKQSDDDLLLERLRHLIGELLSIGSLDQMFGSVRRKVQQYSEEILRMFKTASPAQLNYWLPQINFPQLLISLGDARTRLALVHSLLGNQQKLSVLTLTVVIDGIQKTDTAFSRSEKEQLLAALVCATAGGTLRDLKMVVDHRLSHHNMNRLVFKDITDPSLREQVLEHVREHARLYSDSRCVKILSDIDDTLFCSGGPPGGVDVSIPKGTLYPGIIEFYLELLRGLGNPQFDSTITFLSARPSVGDSGITESATYHRLQTIWDERQVPSPIPNLLPGSLRGSGPSLFGKMDGIAAKKFQNFIEYAQIYPEARFIFIGDNGQADVKTAEMMRDALPERVLAAFIHDVMAEKKPGSVVGSSESHVMISFHRTYIGAAISAFGSNMISAAGLYSISQCAIRQLETIVSWKSPMHRAKVLQMHHSDLETVNHLILEKMLPGPEIHMHPDLYLFMEETLNPSLGNDDDDDDDEEHDEDDPDHQDDQGDPFAEGPSSNTGNTEAHHLHDQEQDETAALLAELDGLDDLEEFKNSVAGPEDPHGQANQRIENEPESGDW
ncbi:MAG: DUF2183 domain-containing protein [archaeon]|nr:DUF2183 domain-containing protein [archaeon]